MSLPKPSHRATSATARNSSSQSSSPSKSSLRSPQQRSSIQHSSRSLLPSPHIAEHKRNILDGGRLEGSASATEQGFGGHDDATQQDQEEELEAPGDEHDEETQHNFHPLFTLLQDVQTAEHYHPTVHYIFEDDDTDIITVAALRSLENSEQGEHGTGAFDQSIQLDEPRQENPSAEQTSHLLLPRVKEHYLLVDLAPSLTRPPLPAAENEQQDQFSSHPPPPLVTKPSKPTSNHPFKVANASSLSPSFAVLSAEIASAPTFESSSTSPVAARNTSNTKRERQRSSSITEPTIQQQQTSAGAPTTTMTVAETETGSGEGLMLRIKCMPTPVQEPQNTTTKLQTQPSEANRQALTTEQRESRSQGSEDLETLLKTFEDRLADIRNLVEASDQLSGAALRDDEEETAVNEPMVGEESEMGRQVGEG